MIELTEYSDGGVPSLKISGVDNFDAYRTFDCGQCFRFENDDGTITGVYGDSLIRIRQSGDTLYLIGATAADYEEKWRKFLDLDEDYAAICDDICTRFGTYNRTIYDATTSAHGIRILRQDRWEALISFIISQNNNIPRIKKIIDTMCRGIGVEKTAYGVTYYTFPTAQAIYDAGIDRLNEFRMGFRSKYLYDAARRVLCGEISLDDADKMDYAAAEEYMMRICGVGKKVAACTLLYGFHKTEAFPVDVWIKRVLEKYYPDGIDMTALGPYAGIAQQYLFCYERYINEMRK